MADIYKIANCSALNVRNKPSMKGKPVKWYKKGQEVKVYKTSGNWYNTSSSGDLWIYNKYAQKIGTEKPKVPPKPTPPSPPPPPPVPVKSDTPIGNSSQAYNKLLKRYVFAFGSPPKYTEAVDPYYGVSAEDKQNGIAVGRAMLQTWFSDPAIFSICPGAVDYLPGLRKSDKEAFINRVAGAVTNDIKGIFDGDKNLDLEGKLYEFKSAYKDYINIVNVLARTSARYMGIGDVSNIIGGNGTKLKNFDYGYYTSNDKGTSTKSIFGQTKLALSTLVEDRQYIHFFVNNAGANVSENITTTPGSSDIENYINNSNLSSIQRNLQFLTGGAVGDSATSSDFNAVIEDVKKSIGGNSILSQLISLTGNYLKGGRLVFPQMITGVGYDKSINVTLKFTSISGDKRSIFKYTILPALHLLAIASPKQISDSMYTYPFLCRVYQKGWVNSDLAFISNLDLKRGGSDDTSWTVDGLSTEIIATFTVTPLYSNLMVTSAAHPILAMRNTALMEYLGTLCGLDLKINNLGMKVGNALSLLGHSVVDIPTNFARGIGDTRLANEIRKFVMISN